MTAPVRGAGPDALGPRGTALAETLLRTLAAHGIERLWFCSGSELVPLQEAAARLRARSAPCPRIATAVHEHVAISAAMGESMVTGGPAAVVAHADLGPLNFGAELHTALRGGYPLLLMSGYPATHPERRTSQAFWNQQRWDQGATLRQYTKWDYKAAPYESIGLIAARALQVALTPPQGPVYLAVPAEVLAQDGCATDVVLAGQLGIGRLGPGDEDAVREIARRLVTARHPLVISERVGRDPEAVRLLDELAAEFALGVAATRYRMNLRDDHPSLHGAPGLAEADAVLVLDHHVPWIPAHEQPAPDAYVAAVGADPIAAEIPLYEFRADVRLFADAGRFLRALTEAMRLLRTAGDAAVIERRAAAHRDAALRAARDRAAHAARELSRDHLTPAAMAYCLNEVIGQEDLLVDELGDTEGLVRRSRPGTLFQNGGSSLGWATSAALGARLASGDTPTVCTTGDGGYLFGVSNAALWTQADQDAPVLTLVANNRGYRTGTSHLDAYYPGGEASRSRDYTGGAINPAPDYAAEATACGGVGIRVRTPAELRAALGRARTAVEHDRLPAVIDVVLPDHHGALPAPGEATRSKAGTGTSRPHHPTAERPAP